MKTGYFTGAFIRSSKTPFMKRILLIVSISCLLFAGCGPTVQYIGRSYSPTTNVDIFFDAKDVKREYEVMGKIDGRAYPLTDFQKIQDKIVEEGKKRGADGIIISDMQNEVVSSSKNTTTTSTGDQKDNTWSASASTTTSINNQTVKVLKAEFIKYK